MKDMKVYVDSNNEIFAYPTNGSQNHLIGDKQEITLVQADDIKQTKAQAQFNALSYKNKRRLEYPSIEDQLDAIYHAGLMPATMAEQIKAVKDKYPKS